MRNIIFAKAGTFKDSDKVYFSSRSRKKNLCYGIYHFTFDHSAGVYHNQLTYGQLKALSGVKVTVFE